MTEGTRRPATRVLIIEDDATTLEFFEQMLVEEGYIVHAVLTCAAGLADAAVHPPDAVLLDLHLPVTDGLDCLRLLRGAPLRLAMPVAILTGDFFLDEDVSRELELLGARIHFKPVWDTDLLQIVEAMVGRGTGGRLVLPM